MAANVDAPPDANAGEAPEDTDERDVPNSHYSFNELRKFIKIKKIMLPGPGEKNQLALDEKDRAAQLTRLDVAARYKPESHETADCVKFQLASTHRSGIFTPLLELRDLPDPPDEGQSWGVLRDKLRVASAKSCVELLAVVRETSLWLLFVLGRQIFENAGHLWPTPNCLPAALQEPRGLRVATLLRDFVYFMQSATERDAEGTTLIQNVGFRAIVFKDNAPLASCERPLATFAEAWPPLARFDTVDIEKEYRDKFKEDHPSDRTSLVSLANELGALSDAARARA